MEISIEEIQKKFDSLPENLKWAIMSAKIDENITEIGKANNLNVSQMGQLSLETHMVIMGFVPTDKFKDSLKASMGIPEEKVDTLVSTVNEKILKKIREYLISTSEDNDTKEDDLPPPDPMEANITEEAVNSVSSQKLSTSFQAPVKKTDYTLASIQKNTPTVPSPTTPPPSPTPPSTSFSSSPATPPAPSRDSAKPSLDPYREIPE